MPKYKTQITHSLGQKLAIERLRENIEWARSMSDLQGTWESEKAVTFKVSVQGIVVEGVINVEEDCLILNARLPLIAVPFKSWMPNILRNAIKKRIVTEENFQPQNSYTSQYNKSESDVTHIILFLHIPKAGGTTLGEYIFNQCRATNDDDEGLIKSGVYFLPDGFFKAADSSVPVHVREQLGRMDLRAVIGHFSYGIHEYVSRQWTYITMLRNPTDRIVSLYRYLKLENRMSIEQFVSAPPFREVDNDQTRRIAGINPKIGGCTSEHLLTAKENLRQHFAVVGVTERLDETLILLKRRLGWTKEILSYPRNVNPVKPSTNLLSAQITEAIRERNKLDFELYEFANDLMNETIASEGSGFDDEFRRYQTNLDTVI